MTTSDTQVSNLIINRLTKAQYEAIQNPSPNEIYIITDEVIASSDIVNALGYTPYNGTTNPNGYTSNTGTVTSVNNVQPSSGNVTLTASDVGSLASSTKYGADLSYSNSQLQLVDQDGNNLGNPVTISGGGASAWGSITGTLSNQTDLQDALDDKVEYAMVIVDYTGD